MIPMCFHHQEAEKLAGLLQLQSLAATISSGSFASQLQSIFTSLSPLLSLDSPASLQLPALQALNISLRRYRV